MAVTKEEVYELKRKVEELERRRSLSGMAKWFPDGPLSIDKYPKHKLFFDLGDTNRERVFMAANRAGKSTAGAYEVACHATGKYPKWWKGKRFTKPLEIWVAGKDKTTTRDTIQVGLLGPLGAPGTGMIPADDIVRTWSMQGVPNGVELAQIRHVSGGYTTIGFKSYDRGVESFFGTARDCVTPDVEVLTKRGWTNAPEVGDTILSLANGTYVWSPVNWVHREQYTGKMYRLESRNNFCVNVTAGHRWLVQHKVTGKTYFARTDELKTSEQLVISGDAVEESCEQYGDAFVQLVGWLVTDGAISKSNMYICQSASYNPAKCKLIETLLQEAAFNWSCTAVPYKHGGGVQNVYAIRGESRKQLLNVVGQNKRLTVEFVNSLSTRQRHLLLESLILGDGMLTKSGGWTITSKHHEIVSTFQYLATLCGYRTLIVNNGKGTYKLRSKSKTSSRYDYTKISVDALTITEYDYSGEVYCPNTNYGTAVFRTDKRAPFVSGQCVWLDEECPEDVYGECLLRTMTTGGIMITTFTPKKGLTPLVLSLSRKSRFVESERFIEMEEGIENPSRVVVMAGWDDVPHLDAEAKKQILEGTPAMLRDAVAKGIPTFGEGNVYPLGRTDIECDPFEIPKHYRRWYGMDVGWNCTAAVFFAQDPDSGQIWITDAYKGERSEPIIHAAAIKTKSKGWMAGAVDPGARQRNQQDGTQLMQIYRDLGLQIIPANNNVESGVGAVWELLSTGKLKVFKSLPSWFAEFMTYIYENGRIKKTNDHLMDATRYGIMTKDRIAQVEPTTKTTSGASHGRRFDF